MKIIGVIPARYESTRFPGKPLADICGKPMIWWVYKNAKKVKELDEVIVATESEKVLEVCNQHDINAMLTSNNHFSGTDRVGEVAQIKDADIYVVLMGDEPLILPKDIKKLIKVMTADETIEACMLATKFKNPVDVVNTTTIKLAINDNDDLIFMSRSPIPFPKQDLEFDYYKNIGLYAFTKETLDFFIKAPKGILEKAEGLEMLRLLENRKRVKVIKIESDSMSVDTMKDLERIKKILIQKKKEQ